MSVSTCLPGRQSSAARRACSAGSAARQRKAAAHTRAAGPRPQAAAPCMPGASAAAPPPASAASPRSSSPGMTSGGRGSSRSNAAVASWAAAARAGVSEPQEVDPALPPSLPPPPCGVAWPAQKPRRPSQAAARTRAASASDTSCGCAPLASSAACAPPHAGASGWARLPGAGSPAPGCSGSSPVQVVPPLSAGSARRSAAPRAGASAPSACGSPASRAARRGGSSAAQRPGCSRPSRSSPRRSAGAPPCRSASATHASRTAPAAPAPAPRPLRVFGGSSERPPLRAMPESRLTAAARGAARRRRAACAPHSAPARPALACVRRMHAAARQQGLRAAKAGAAAQARAGRPGRWRRRRVRAQQPLVQRAPVQHGQSARAHARQCVQRRRHVARWQRAVACSTRHTPGWRAATRTAHVGRSRG